jgi:hypothetical protein
LGSEIIKRNEAAVTLFYGVDGKIVRIMVMAGEAAVAKGVNANETVRERSANAKGFFPSIPCCIANFII